MGDVGRISSAEMMDLSLSLAALVLAFSLLGERRLVGVEVIIISAVGVGSGFLLHELAHKFVAQRFGYLAEYRANRTGLVLIVLMAAAGFIFAAPGAVVISKASVPQEYYHLQGPAALEGLRSQARREELCISLAGPMTNIFLAAIFFLLLASGAAGFWAGAASFALFINLTLAAFNLLPFGPLDGKKILDGSRLVWAIVAVPTILAALPVYLGMV